MGEVLLVRGWGGENPAAHAGLEEWRAADWWVEAVLLAVVELAKHGAKLVQGT